MPHAPIETTVIGSYPFPGWLELCTSRTDELGPDDADEAARDATLVAIMDQVRAGLDVISDGEQGRFDFNLSFYAYLDGLELEDAPRRRWGPPAHDQRGRLFQRFFIIGQSNFVRRADFDELRVGLLHNIRNAKSPTDLHQLRTGNDHAFFARKRREHKQQRGGIIVDDHRGFCPCEFLQNGLRMDEAGAAPPLLQVVLERGIILRRLSHGNESGIR